MTDKLKTLLTKKKLWERCNLRHLEIEDTGAVTLADMMAFVHIDELLLAKNNITHVGVSVLAEALATGSVDVLDLSRNCFGPKGATALCRSLGNASLRDLSIARNSIGNEGAEAFAALLKQPECKLERLNLRCCGIEGKGMQDLAQALLGRDLAELVIAENSVGPVGAASLAEALSSVKELILYDAVLGAEGAMHLAHAVSGSGLEKLDICHNNIQDAGAKCFAQSLRMDSCSLSWLSLTSNHICEEGAEDIAASLLANRNLKELRLSRNSPGVRGLTALVKSLQQNRTLQVLALNSTKLGDEGAGILGDSLPGMAGIRRICLQHNAIGDEGIVALTSGLCSNESVIDIDLDKNNFGNEGCIAIAHVLNCRQDFERLMLGRNQIEDEGVEDLAKALGRHRCLQEIDLQKNRIVWGGIQLGEAICENQVLEIVVLSCNQIQIPGAQQFAAAAKMRKRGSQPLSLDMSACYIGHQGASALAGMLEQNPRLLVLEIASNDLGDVGIRAIAKALKRNRELEKLNLRDNNIQNGGASDLADTLPDTCIQFIDLDENYIDDDGAKFLSRAVDGMMRLAEMRLRKNLIKRKGYDQLKRASWSSALKFKKSPPKIRVSVFAGFRMCGLAVEDAKGVTSLRHAWDLVKDSMVIPEVAGQHCIVCKSSWQANDTIPVDGICCGQRLRDGVLDDNLVWAQRADSDSEADLQCVTSQQRKHIKNMLPGASQHDPAQNPEALDKNRHKLRKIDVRLLRQSHDTVNSVFGHGPHKGRPVETLLEELHSGKNLEEITPLVVVTSKGQHWVVFGNRRLKCLKDYARQVAPRLVEMLCIVHNFDNNEFVDKSLLAKFLDSATTENNGVSASFRSGRATLNPDPDRVGIMSAASGCRPKCFVDATLLEDLEQRYVRADRLKENDHVLGDGAIAVRVVSKQLHTNEQQKLVEFEAGDAKLTVTSSHRVMVQRRQLEAAPAASLRLGDDVLCRGCGLQKVTHIRSFDAEVNVVELGFSPDIPVAAFLAPQDMIMTKGRGRGRWCKRGKGKSKGSHSHWETWSIPDTEWTCSKHTWN